MFRRVSVIGAGGWGTALAVLLCENGGQVRMWSHSEEVAREIAECRTNSHYLPGVKLPRGVDVTTELGEVLDSDLVVFVTPAKAVREVAMRMGGLRKDAVLVSCVKGLEQGKRRLMSDVLQECLPGHRLGVLSGPNLAMEVARGVPAAAVVGCGDEEVLARLQAMFSTRTFRVYVSGDVAGIQLGGALKNVFAIGAGISDGLGLGENAKAALVTRALAEMVRLGCALGGRRETFFGLSGAGDLMVTCFSGRSRNRSFGERVGLGERPEEILGSMKMVVEGVSAAREARGAAEELGVDVPIISSIYSVLYEGKAPGDAMRELLARPPRREPENLPA